MSPTVFSKAASVVLLGRFDLKPFYPQKLVADGVLSKPELFDLELENLVSGRIVNFKVGSLSFLVERTRVQIEVSAPPFIRAADIASKVIHDNAEVPWNISAVGINLHTHFRFGSFEGRDALGRRLAPLEPWGDWGKKLLEAARIPPNEPGHPGMTSIVMRLPLKKERITGWTEVRVESSSKLPTDPGVYIGVNQHREFADDADSAPENDVELLSFIESSFDSALRESEEIIDSLLADQK